MMTLGCVNRTAGGRDRTGKLGRTDERKDTGGVDMI